MEATVIPFPEGGRPMRFARPRSGGGEENELGEYDGPEDMISVTEVTGSTFRMNQLVLQRLRRLTWKDQGKIAPEDIRFVTMCLVPLIRECRVGPEDAHVRRMTALYDDKNGFVRRKETYGEQAWDEIHAWAERRVAERLVLDSYAPSASRGLGLKLLVEMMALLLMRPFEIRRLTGRKAA